MRFYLFLLFFFSCHRSIFIITADSTYLNKNNSEFHIHLYQCSTNNTILNTTTITLHSIFNNLIDSCNISCCTSTHVNNISSSNLCQVTVQSSTGICLGRLCYSDQCDRFASLANITDENKMKNKTTTTTTIIDQLRSTFASIPWSSFVNSTQTKLSSWTNKTGLTKHHTILIVLFIINIFFTSMTLTVVIKSIRHAKMIAEDRSYRYTLL